MSRKMRLQIQGFGTQHVPFILNNIDVLPTPRNNSELAVESEVSDPKVLQLSRCDRFIQSLSLLPVDTS